VKLFNLKAKAALCVPVLLTLLVSLPSHGQERYISDTLLVPLRAGTGNNYRIVHRGLPSGTQLQLLEEVEDDSGNAWSHVRTPGGLEGWVRNQHLLEEPTAALKLAQLNRRMSQLDGNQRQLLDNNEELEASNSQLQEQLTELQDTYQDLQQQHSRLQDLSANAVTLNEEHKALSESYQLLQTRIEVLQTENERLQNNRRYREWIMGAGILFFGIILSLILQSIGRRKRQSEWR